MAFSMPRTWTTGELVTAAHLNQDVRDNMLFLANPPACRVYHNTTQVMADATETVVAFNSERYDTDSMHSTVTNNSRITFTTGGLYLLTFNGVLAALTTYSLVYTFFRLNGTTSLGYAGFTPTAFSASPNLVNTTVYKFAAADYVQVLIYQDNTANVGVNLNSGANYSPEFSATWIGLGS